ncbi:hypothetical protein [Sorangium sp. So ce128]|uniref:hypothetical protein n=1 Tax=Sorangium sp. So ce128 TaxID=3133281 RepID=UPI003F60A1B2
MCDGHGACVEPGAPLWSVSFPGEASFASINADGASNVLLTGQLSGTADLGGGPLTSAGQRDVLIAKLDPDGGLAWARRYGGPGDEFGAKIAALSDGSLVNAGGYVDSLDVGAGPIPSAGLSDIYVMRTDPAGDPAWVRHFGDPAYQDVYGLSVDGEDNVVVLGSFEGTVDFGAGPVSSAGAQDIFLFKLDPAGNTLWSKGVGSDSSDGSVALTTDPMGNVLFGGSVGPGADLGGGPLPDPRLFVAKLDPAGNHLWSRTFGDTSGFIQDVEVDPAGNVVVAGQTGTTIDLGTGPIINEGYQVAFLAKLDAAGNTVWSRGFSAPESLVVITSIDVDSQANVVASGVLVADVSATLDFDGIPFPSGYNPSRYSARTFLVKFDAGGHVLWVEGFDTERPFSIVVDPLDRVLATATFTGTLDLGSGPLTGDEDVFVAAFGP